MIGAYYDTVFNAAQGQGLSIETAADHAATSFLDGKPSGQGKRKCSAADRHAAFWSSHFLRALPAQAWQQESLSLALARYLGQDRVACPEIVAHVAMLAPDVLQQAARHAGLVLRQASPRWLEIEALADSQPGDFSEFVQVFRIFKEAHQLRLDEVEHLREPLAKLTPLDLLAYTSLYAFEHLLPDLLEGGSAPDTQETWDAVEDILTWKLATCDAASLRLTDTTIAASLRQHLTPFLFPSLEAPGPRHDLYAGFTALLDAQIELNAFINRSAEAFSYDGGIRFVRQGERLEIMEVDAQARAAWRSDGDKLNRLHQYWLYRGMDALMASHDLLALVSPAHLEANLQAFAKAMGTWLRLQEVYGIAEQVRTEAGSAVDVFRALLATELMTAFYIEDFLRPYHQHLQQLGHPWLTLGRLAFGGLLQSDMQNRFPITWSDRSAKIARITPWTATAEHPQGQARAAEAILDFWTSDWSALAERLREGDAALRPRWQERPVLKMGRHLFQLPWMMAMQNNATAAVNNLRRLGARRNEAREETRRIEARLGMLFEQRGFRVLVGHEFAAGMGDEEDAGEIDLLCALEGHLLVLELKSTYQRRSMKDAWMHRTSTLRKAGWQLHRKVPAVRHALQHDASLRQALALPPGAEPQITAWIVDTSIEWNHQAFRGFLKILLEEIQIALRDDRRWLNDPEGLFRTAGAGDVAMRTDTDAKPIDTLYPDGFSARKFIEVVESAAVWAAAA
ncbi:hypothetical protein [Comamonas flocculans]|uniref:NERD domain-containing protein n=1 Tax=Comamonas flocculans TaxID=2597701 RepID=A0A5B8RYU2_9BURK|nr:hypothetical protein [Comamonas flocculans]QEA13954.1 hypothetical protein FOZ74_13490 [Comamonas flocculans]